MKVKELIEYEEKSKIKAGEAVANGQYPFFTSSEAEDKRYDKYTCDTEGIIMGTGGNATLHYYKGKFAVSTDCLVLKTNQSVKCKYLYYFFKANMKVLQDGFKGAGLKHTNKNYIENIELNMLPNTKEQLIIIERLDKISNLIQKHKNEINHLDTLIKARFVEMFGGIKVNKKCMKDICKSIVDGSHNPSKGVSYETEYLMLSSKNVINNILTHDEPRYLTKDEFFVENQRTNVELNDVLLTIVGTVGRSAVVNENSNITFQRSVAVLKPKLNIINSLYLKYYLDVNNDIVINKAHGIAQIGIYLDQVRSLQIDIPSIDLQNTFATFVNEVDKLKFDVQKSLEKTQMLFDSLMQKYFSN